MPFFDELAKGGVEGLVKGAGQFARDIRAAITGKEPMTSEQQARILERADALEAAGQQLEASAAAGQQKLNELDSSSDDKYRTRWRPTIGWICAAGIGYQFLFRPISSWALTVIFTFKNFTPEQIHSMSNMPGLDSQQLIALTLTLLGFGGQRMYEKIKGKP